MKCDPRSCRHTCARQWDLSPRRANLAATQGRFLEAACPSSPHLSQSFGPMTACQASRPERALQPQPQSPREGAGPLHHPGFDNFLFQPCPLRIFLFVPDAVVHFVFVRETHSGISGLELFVGPRFPGDFQEISGSPISCMEFLCQQHC